MEIKGKLLEISNEQVLSDKFKKREFVVEYAENPQYPELIKLEFIQDKCSLLDGYQVGNLVDVQFNLKGRKWDDPKGGTKYFNTLQAWKIAKVENSAPIAKVENSAPVAVADQGDESNELPF